MKFHKLISTILHPIVIPTIGVLVYFILIPNAFNKAQRFAVLGLIFVSTYLVPLLILVLFKKLKLIQSFNAETIKERKIPVAIMIVFFYILGNTLEAVPNLRDLGLLFYATSMSLVFTFIAFSFQFKASLHLLSLGLSTGFFIVLGFIYSTSFIAVTIVAILLSGLLGASRLHLNAHTKNEVYVGFFFGFFATLLTYY